MFQRLFSVGRLAAPAGLALGLMLGAQPVLADTELGHTGTVGPHIVSDGFAAVTCAYTYLPASDVYRLTKINVAYPSIAAVVGKSHQKVGWQAIVQRKYGGYPTSNLQWVNDFASAEMTAYTSDNSYANFQNFRHISVTVPYGPSAQNTHYAAYRVLIKMFWHTPSGGVQGTALHRHDHYYKYDSSSSPAYAALVNAKCDGYVTSV